MCISFKCDLKSSTGIGIVPNLQELQYLEGPNGEALRIIQTVAPNWQRLAMALGFDGPRIMTIKKDSFHQTEDACCHMFFRWLAGEHDLKPPTWGTLIECLILSLIHL